VRIDTELVRRAVPRAVRTHPFLSVLVAAALLGGGLRYVPAGAAAVTGSEGSGQGASTACAAS